MYRAYKWIKKQFFCSIHANSDYDFFIKKNRGARHSSISLRISNTDNGPNAAYFQFHSKDSTILKSVIPNVSATFLFLLKKRKRKGFYLFYVSLHLGRYLCFSPFPQETEHPDQGLHSVVAQSSSLFSSTKSTPSDIPELIRSILKEANKYNKLSS